MSGDGVRLVEGVTRWEEAYPGRGNHSPEIRTGLMSTMILLLPASPSPPALCGHPVLGQGQLSAQPP